MATGRRTEEERNLYLWLSAIMAIGSLTMIAGAVYIMKTYTLWFGIGAGVYLQAYASNSIIVPALSSTASSLVPLHQSILETYVLATIALLIAGVSFLMFVRNYDARGTVTNRKYAAPYLALVVVYLMLLYITASPFYNYLKIDYMYILYTGVSAGILSSAYLEYMTRRSYALQKQEMPRNSISVDASKPFTNALELQEGLIAKLGGNLIVVDKHFNSTGLANFHRLISSYTANFNKVTILTSRGMLDSDFMANISDFRREMGSYNIELDVRLMDEKDAVDQHERLLIDDRVAYKVPPFSIINKRSEHITRISASDARASFSHLYSRAIKLDNYAIKQARSGGSD